MVKRRELWIWRLDLGRSGALLVGAGILAAACSTGQVPSGSSPSACVSPTRTPTATSTATPTVRPTRTTAPTPPALPPWALGRVITRIRTSTRVVADHRRAARRRVPVRDARDAAAL